MASYDGLLPPNENSNRLTFAGGVVEFLPGAIAPQSHIQKLIFDSAVTGGTFKLQVNGNFTAAITMSATAATLVTSINTALDALPNLTDGELVASGTDIAAITITAAANKYYRIIPHDIDLSQTTPNNNRKLQTRITTQGSSWVSMHPQLASLDVSEETETTDVTPISQFAREEIPVASSASITLNMYMHRYGTANMPEKYMFPAGIHGVLRVFPEGKEDGYPYTELIYLLTGMNDTYPDKDKIEYEISANRQGNWLAEPGSIWKSS